MTTEQSEFYVRIWEIWNDLDKIVPEFEITFKDPIIRDTLPLVQDVYMHEIIISLWMILGDGRSDKFTLSKLGKYFPNRELTDKVVSLLSEHSDLIGKLGNNRNWISAHRDPQLTGLGYSRDFVKVMEEKFDTKFTSLRSKDKINERYTPHDMRDDLPEIRRILKNINEIWRLIPKCFVLVNKKPPENPTDA